MKIIHKKIKAALHTVGAVGQVAGGVPAMCDGVTQGARWNGAITAKSRCYCHVRSRRLSHNMFDGALYLGFSDKIVPGLYYGSTVIRSSALAIFVPGRVQ